MKNKFALITFILAATLSLTGCDFIMRFFDSEYRGGFFPIGGDSAQIPPRISDVSTPPPGDTNANKASYIYGDLKDLSNHIKETDQLRSRYTALPDSLRQDLHDQIIQAERHESTLQNRINHMTAELNRIRDEFLNKGMIITETPVQEPRQPQFTWQCHTIRQPFSERERRIIERSGDVMYVTVLPEDSLILRSTSRDLTPDELTSPLLRTLLDKMETTVTSPQQGGVGIAAPQVGLNFRIVLVQRLDKPSEPFEAYINIHIDSLSGPIHTGPEGCLSVPGKRGMVKRYSSVTISYLDGKTLEPRTETIEGYTAIIFQHECDHLDGILYIDRTDIVADNPDSKKEREQYDYSRPDWW